MGRRGRSWVIPHEERPVLGMPSEVGGRCRHCRVCLLRGLQGVWSFLEDFGCRVGMNRALALLRLRASLQKGARRTWRGILGAFWRRIRGRGPLLPRGSRPGRQLSAFRMARTHKHQLTFGTRPRMTRPSAADNMDMTTRLANAPPKTVTRECRLAMMAAIKKVLSPILSAS
jgi:hypothetical protein